MFKFVVRRLFQLIPVLLGVSILVFAMMHLTPGNPAKILAGQGASAEAVANMEEEMGLNDPIIVQYGNFLYDAVTLNFGTSWKSGLEVSKEIGPKFVVTVELALYSTMLSLFIGLIAGIVSAVRKYTLLDVSIMIIALFGLSMPNFWLGIMLMQWFSIQLGWLPATGWGTPEQIILPVITLGTAGAAVVARMTRSSMLDVISQDYIRTARAKGLKEGIVIYRHALKNALIPVVTVVGLQFGLLLSGAVLTETVFAINGIGGLIVDRINARDFPVVQASVLVMAVVFVFVNLLVDLTYKFLNKRIDLD
ncbi:ABC transporter permease [Aquisalibacillus elongatus]|uniref:Peptide/nickel transport system permease protein n=1 Tax=Aquisalibacillus elongatus TaxID=485577 RepID=A0A3N5BW37_9BACI|nr:ABC transporter permease [Aquisalibacillus elongatus]RPF54008.1 peptide/nickel transport system permease protein [Aquisalibacillus elongatus]